MNSEPTDIKKKVFAEGERRKFDKGGYIVKAACDMSAEALDSGASEELIDRRRAGRENK